MELAISEMEDKIAETEAEWVCLRVFVVIDVHFGVF